MADLLNIKKYDYFEQSFQAEFAGNPFDIELIVQVKCPDGSIKTVYGFYDGENTFAFRFMPEQLGEYSYQTICQHNELNNKTGEFICIENDENNHGRVKVCDKYWFSYEDGTPYFPTGTTCYAWIHQSPDMQAQTIKTLLDGCFNKVRMCVFPKWYEYNHSQPYIYPFEGNPKSGFDYDKPNVSFFKHLDNCIIQLKKIGVEADVILFHPYENEEWQFNFMTPEQDLRYIKYITARLSAFHNVWWSLANEYDLIRTGYKKKKSAWAKLAKTLRELDCFNHLISIHQLNKMFDHKNKYITHCSIQRTELFLTAEYTDTWREKYGKPVIIDECVYEGNLNSWWGGITAEEMVRRFWEATARGGYLSHGESYLTSDEKIWWSHGGTLVGESQQRIKFLRQIMLECPDIKITSESGTSNTARGIAGTNTQLIYLGNYQPCNYSFTLLGNAKYRIKIIDTWNMSVDELPDLYEKNVTVDLPSKPYMAILCVAENKAEGTKFTRDSVFEEMKFTVGGRKMLKFLKKICAPYYSGMLQFTVNQCSKQAGGILDGKAGDGILTIVNENKFFKGMLQLITGVLFRR